MDNSSFKSTEAFRVKVQRLTKPKIVPAEIKSLSFPFSTEAEKKSLYSTFVPFYLGNSYFQLNPEFGKMYVGETLRAIVSIVNISNYVIESANIYVEMTTESKAPLEGNPPNVPKDVKESIPLKNVFHQTIRPQETIVFPLEYKVEDADTYYLALNIVFKHEVYTQTNQGIRSELQEKNQTKRFRFDAKLPYKLEHRAHRDRETGKVFIEISLENNSKNTLFFKEITFLCSEMYNLIQLVTNEEEDLNKLSLNVNEGHHFIFALEPRKTEEPINEHKLRELLGSLGQLYTEWYNITNESGKATSPLITIPIPHYDLSIEFTEPLTHLIKEIIRPTELVIKNETNIPVDLLFQRVEKEMTGLKIISCSKQELKLGPKQSGNIVLFVLPIRLGIYRLGGLKIYNRLTQKELTFNQLPGVVIDEEEEALQLEGVQQQNYEDSLI